MAIHAGTVIDGMTKAAAQAELEISGASGITFNQPASDLTAGTVAERETLTVGESVVFGNALYLKSDGKWWKTDADAASTMPGLRMALETKSADQTCSTLVKGYARDDSWAWTVGGLIYFSTTAAALTQTAPSGTGDQVQIAGIAYTADIMFFAPSPVLGEIT